MVINTSFKLVPPGLRDFLIFRLFIVVKDGWKDFFVFRSCCLLKQWLSEGRRDAFVFMERRRAVVRVPEGCHEWSCQDFRLMQRCVDFVKLERDYVQDEVCPFCVKRQLTKICIWSQHQVGQCSSSMGSFAAMFGLWGLWLRQQTNRFAIPVSECYRVFNYLCCSFRLR